MSAGRARPTEAITFRRGTTITILVTAALTVTACAGTAPSPAPTEPVGEATAERLQAILDDAIGDDRTGTAVTVLREGAGTWSAVAGTSDWSRPLEPGAKFEIASTSKTFIAAVILRFAEVGRLSLDDPIADHLPVDLDFDSSGTTIRDHLAMESGIPDGSDPLNGEPERLREPAEVLATVPDTRREPGTHSYSNLSYYLLGLVIEEVSGTTTAQAVRAEVLDDPRFDTIVTQPEEQPEPPLALPLAGPGVRKIILDLGGDLLMTPAEASAFGGSGNMASDSEALAVWWYELFSGSILSDASLAAMTDVEGDDYGLGLFGRPAVRGVEGAVYANGGRGIGHMSYVLTVPDAGLVVVVLRNRGGDPEATLGPLAYQFAAAVGD
ncbi:serine hydrolase domain-containing protein [Agromyces protaetiae]|nr:serine hydrolase domain-containing protein [Agromyces protaetiae]